MRRLALTTLILFASSASACGVLTPELLALTRNAASAYGLEPPLLHALLWEESRYCHARRGAVTTSHAGALGIGQLMPETAQDLGVDPLRVDENVLGAARYLRLQWDTFGDWQLALAAYNAGPGAVTRYGGVPPYEETQAYVQKVLTSYAHLKAEASKEPSQSAIVAQRGASYRSAVIYQRRP